jgi:hypothetical protein
MVSDHKLAKARPLDECERARKEQWSTFRIAPGADIWWSPVTARRFRESGGRPEARQSIELKLL